ncbi:Dehydrogenase [Aspergillus sclerotialis]|uniref:Dehydrogenase n=1 Tax=Aspergillus sclerotialis TaxID=2070753 RepID=A0A3A2Z6B1_9EURO|nr:Dehydrogenase [Aspergillus sclerotialis]
MTRLPQSSQFDYIVVGGGIGGMVVASRLSEEATTTVLLIEAGPDRTGDPRIETPGLLTTLFGNPVVDWDFLSEPQTHVKDRQIPQARGRVLGGSSALNFSAVVYPSRQDWAAWSALGNEGWSAEHMEPYLQKFQTYKEPDTSTTETLGLDHYVDPSKYGSQGPLPVGYPAIYGPFNKAWNQAFAKLGWQDKKDPISGDKSGSFTCQLSVDPATGVRGYATSYRPAERPNLTVWTEARAEKIHLARNSKDELLATGVQISDYLGVQRTATARHEIVLSAGSIHSPQLLELSGIGGAQRLRLFGIPVMLDLPGVGENLQDHCISSISYKVTEGHSSTDAMRDPHVAQNFLNLYEKTRSGPLAGLPISGAFLPPVNDQGKVPMDDIRSLVEAYLPNNQNQHQTGRQKQTQIHRQTLLDNQEPTILYLLLPFRMNTKPGAMTMADIFEHETEDNYISIVAMLSHPFSRGSVHIKSGDVRDKPTFNPNYLEHPMDLELLARHTQYIDRVVHTEPFRMVVRPECRLPQSSEADLTDLESVKQVVQDRLLSCFHPVGTCAMMPLGMGGVVDDQLRVHGTRNLRVVDASIFPLEPQGNIQATVYAVAERAADHIKQSQRE